MSAIFQSREATHPPLPCRDTHDSLWRATGEEPVPGRAWRWAGVLGITGLGVPRSRLKTTSSPYHTLEFDPPSSRWEEGSPAKGKAPSTKLIQHRARSRAQVSQVPKPTFPGQNVQWEETKSTTTRNPLPIQRNRKTMAVSR